MAIQNAIRWALGQLEVGELPSQHGFVDLVRRYLNEHGIKHPPLSFEDVAGYLEELQNAERR